MILNSQFDKLAERGVTVEFLEGFFRRSRHYRVTWFASRSALCQINRLLRKNFNPFVNLYRMLDVDVGGGGVAGVVSNYNIFVGPDDAPLLELLSPYGYSTYRGS